MENPKFSFEDKKKLLDVQLKDVSQLACNLAYLLTSQGNFELNHRILKLIFRNCWMNIRVSKKLKLLRPSSWTKMKKLN